REGSGLARRLGLGLQQRIEQWQDTRLAGAGREDAGLCGPVGDHRADAVTAERCGPRKERRRAHDQRRFQLPPRPEEEPGLQIDEQPYGTLPLLAKELGMRPSAPRRDTPVDVARVVARYVRADLLKLQPASALCTRVHAERCRARRFAPVQR